MSFRSWLVLGILFIGLAFFGVYILAGFTPTASENFLVTLILAAASWFISAELSNESAKSVAEDNANAKIDDIAWLSSKKLADQSTNFFELEKYIEQTLIEKNNISSISETDLTAIIRDLRQLRRANTGLMQDWNRVASTNLTSEITSWIEEQLTLFGELDFTYGSASSGTAISADITHLPLSARPTRSAPVIFSVNQNVDTGASESENSGELIVEILRPAFNFTAGGKIEPQFADAPKLVDVELIDAPENTPLNKCRGGTGTTFDFSVHLKSEEYGVTLPRGTYRFKYQLA